jgi:hypothetical protein
MAAKTGTYTLIASSTLSSTSATVTFSSIPGTYTDLLLVASAKGTGTGDIALRFNDDSATNYSATHLYGTGSAAGSIRYSGDTFARIDYYGYLETTDFTVNLANIMDYANTTTYKTVLSRASHAANGTNAGVSLWRSTSAITKVVVMITNSSQFVSGSTFKLYGIEAGNL